MVPSLCNIRFAMVLMAASLAYLPQSKALTLKIATLTPHNNSLTKAIRDAGEEIEQKTNGAVTMKVYPGGIMGNSTMVRRKMRAGQLHGASFTAGSLAEIYRDFQVLSLPLLFQNYQEADAARKGIEPILLKRLESRGYKAFGLLESGFAYVMSSVPIKKPDDLRGKKIWIPRNDPVSQAIFEVAKVPPVSAALSDVRTGLQTGLLDTVAGSPIAAIVLQWFTKIKYFNRTPLLYTYGTVALSNRAWKRLTPEQQKVVESVFAKHLTPLNQSVREDNKNAIKTLKKEGIQFTEFDDQSFISMKEIAKKSISILIEREGFDKELIEKVKSITATIRNK